MSADTAPSLRHSLNAEQTNERDPKENLPLSDRESIFRGSSALAERTRRITCSLRGIEATFALADDAIRRWSVQDAETSRTNVTWPREKVRSIEVRVIDFVCRHSDPPPMGICYAERSEGSRRVSPFNNGAVGSLH
jgi:hypothetical protein